jgi:C4-type Zn-finger protein
MKCTIMILEILLKMHRILNIIKSKKCTNLIPEINFKIHGGIGSNE